MPKSRHRIFFVDADMAAGPACTVRMRQPSGRLEPVGGLESGIDGDLFIVTKPADYTLEELKLLVSKLEALRRIRRLYKEQ